MPNYVKLKNKMSLKEIIKEKREEIINIADQHGAFNLRLFGSVARGEETEQSDIDFLIDYDLDKISSWFPSGLVEDLETLLKRRVDVVTINSLHYLIRDKVLSEAIVL
ncbi:DNA polymerase subunit beta [Dulcicalothrix desertica PCC 7102]|uniref:DNA polymerase subunit beta n=2 Tax=Dulcicalothrix desertica TaxID=32056 RepID=A0A3S1CAJ0_9CYAN|nr:DNA polymerase subunit beta [Dulcicalothrix desertica PCC 7102]